MALVPVAPRKDLRSPGVITPNETQPEKSVSIDIPRDIFRDMKMEDMQYLLRISIRIPVDGEVVELGGEDTRPAIVIGMGLMAHGSCFVHYVRYTDRHNPNLVCMQRSRMVKQQQGSIKDHVRKVHIESIVAIAREESLVAAGAHEPESLDLVLISKPNNYEGYLRDLHIWATKLKSTGLVLFYCSSLNTGMIRAANRFAFERGMLCRINSPSRASYFIEMYLPDPLHETYPRQWFAAPDWGMTNTWRPVIERYLQAYSSDHNCMLSLYAGDLTSSDTQTAYKLILEHLESCGLDPENIPEIEVSNSLALGENVTILLSGGKLDSHLEKRYSRRCFEFRH